LSVCKNVIPYFIFHMREITITENVAKVLLSNRELVASIEEVKTDLLKNWNVVERVVKGGVPQAYVIDRSNDEITVWGIIRQYGELLKIVKMSFVEFLQMYKPFPDPDMPDSTTPILHLIVYRIGIVQEFNIISPNGVRQFLQWILQQLPNLVNNCEELKRMEALLLQKLEYVKKQLLESTVYELKYNYNFLKGRIKFTAYLMLREFADKETFDKYIEEALKLLPKEIVAEAVEEGISECLKEAQSTQYAEHLLKWRDTLSKIGLDVESLAWGAGINLSRQSCGV